MSKKKKPRKHRQPDVSNTPLSGHKRVGKTLVPPIMGVRNITFQSWVNDRLPEMLWACLVVGVLPREAALGAFREIAAVGLKYRNEDDDEKTLSLRVSDLPSQPSEIVERIVKTVVRHPLGYAALRPLLLLEELPGRDIWRGLLSAEPLEGDWETLGQAVAKTFDHQSQEATDVRWLTLLFKIAIGKLHYPEALREKFEELIDYPNRGDMRSVRPFIRAGEGALSMGMDGESQKSVWAEAFWKECLDRTHCFPATPENIEMNGRDTEALVKELLNIRGALLDHWAQTIQTSGVDARHDAVFGFSMFALSCLLEMLSGLNGFGISGRVLLRTLAESRISLAYLARCGDEAMWGIFRAYGTGQAKLALLKLDEIPGDAPNFVSRETLAALANEDFFQEYVKMDLGHWCGKDLRRMAEDSGTKDDYDRFYGWASGFVHGQWGALRDSNMTFCLNPLHRFHRIPLISHRKMDDVVPDAVGLVNAILDEVSDIYPGFEVRFTALKLDSDRSV